MLILSVILLDISDPPADVSYTVPGFTESPLFIVGVIIAVILIAIVLRRFVFDNTTSEYRHNHDD